MDFNTCVYFFKLFFQLLYNYIVVKWSNHRRRRMHDILVPDLGMRLDVWVIITQFEPQKMLDDMVWHILASPGYTGVTSRWGLVLHHNLWGWGVHNLCLSSLVPYLRLIAKELHDSCHLLPGNLSVHLSQKGVQPMKLLQGNTSSPSLRIRGQHFTECLQSLWQGLYSGQKK